MLTGFCALDSICDLRSVVSGRACPVHHVSDALSIGGPDRRSRTADVPLGNALRGTDYRPGCCVKTGSEGIRLLERLLKEQRSVTRESLVRYLAGIRFDQFWASMRVQGRSLD